MTHADCLPKVKFQIVDYPDVISKIWEIAHYFGVDIPDEIGGGFFTATKRAHDVYYNQLPHNVLGSYPLNA